jgi:hypothetical protein
MTRHAASWSWNTYFNKERATRTAARAAARAQNTTPRAELRTNIRYCHHTSHDRFTNGSPRLKAQMLVVTTLLGGPSTARVLDSLLVELRNLQSIPEKDDNNMSRRQNNSDNDAPDPFAAPLHERRLNAASARVQTAKDVFEFDWKRGRQREFDAEYESALNLQPLRTLTAAERRDALDRSDDPPDSYALALERHRASK